MTAAIGAGRRWRRGAAAAPRGTVVSVVHRLEGGGALGGGVVLGPDPAQRPVGLRREQQHGQRRLQAEVTAGQPESGDHGDQGDREGGDQLERGRGGEREPEHVAVGPAVAVGDLPDPRRLGGGAPVGDQRRQPAHDVDEVAGRAGPGAATAGPRAPGWTARSGSAKTGTSGRVSTHDERADPVLARDRDHGQDRQHARRRRAPGGSGSGRARWRPPRGWPARPPRRSGAGRGRWRPGRARAGGRYGAASYRPGRRRARRGRPRPPAARHRARSVTASSDDRCACQPRPYGSATTPTTSRRERERLGDDEQRRRAPARPRPRPARRASRPEVGEDPGVERPHAGASASSAVGMWCTAIRLRKTQ